MKKAVKLLIWAYALLILLEGALRKWFFPGSADLLLIMRDPVLLLIYALAVARGDFPVNRFVTATGLLALVSVGAALVGDTVNPVIIAYGIRINYLHLPLIWVIAEYFDRRDVERLGTVYLLCAIPIALLMIEQFRSSPLAWVNKGIGGDEGGQIYGAEGRIRPPGPFAFITGPQTYIPLCAAFVFGQLQQKKRLFIPLLVACACSVLVCVPISISRTVAMATLIVGATYFLTLFLSSGSLGKFIKPFFITAAIGVLALQLPIFSDGMRAFNSRWEQAAVSQEGNGWADIWARTLNTLTNPLDYAINSPTLGHGIGMGSNVAARLTQGSLGFMLAEEEYAKIYMELGFLIGTGFIALRITLALHLLLVAWRALKEQKYSLPLLILSASANIIIFGQWAPPTILGFSVLCAGLVLACARPPQEETPVPAEPEDNTTLSAPESLPPANNSHRLTAVPKGESRSPSTPHDTP